MHFGPSTGLKISSGAGPQVGQCAMAAVDQNWTCKMQEVEVAVYSAELSLYLWSLEVRFTILDIMRDQGFLLITSVNSLCPNARVE